MAAPVDEPHQAFRGDLLAHCYRMLGSVAQVLDTTPASVNSSLQRARATLRAAGLGPDELREPADPSERAVVDRYIAAFEAADVGALTRLVSDDVVLEMPPVALWLQGRDRYREFMARIFDARWSGWRAVPVRANGSAALAAYAPDPSGGTPRPHSLQTFDVSGGLVRRCVTFVDAGVLGLFDVPATPPGRPRADTSGSG